MHPSINLTHLKFFCDAITYNSISEAAKMNYVTQSTVSQAIAKLEMILAVELINHARQRFNVTAEGRVLYEQARHVFKAVQDIHDKINSQKETPSGTLKFVCTNSLGISYLPHLYKQMQTEFPALALRFHLGNLNAIRTALRQGEVDFAIVVYDQSFSQFSKFPLKRGKFHLYQHCDAPLHQIENGILVDQIEGMHVAALKDYFRETNRNEIHILSELAGWEVVARFTEMNMGVGFFPDYIKEQGRYPQLNRHPQKIPLFEYEICAIYNRGEKPSRAAAAFFDHFTLMSDK